MAATAMQSDLKFMAGTTTGPSYLAFARKGSVLLGVKPWAVHDGGASGVKGTTYFAVRIRSARDPEGEPVSESNVVAFKKAVTDLGAEWPGITWEKNLDTHAATTIGAFIPGRFSPTNDDELQQLMTEVADKKLATKLANYLIDLVGSPEHLIISGDQLRDWLDDQFMKVIKKTHGSIMETKKSVEVFNENVGVFSMEADLLKKVYAKTKAAHDTAVEDVEAEDAEDEDAEG